jgi:hypothetical protein
MTSAPLVESFPSQSKKINDEPARDMLDWSRPERANSAACLSISARHLLLSVQPQRQPAAKCEQRDVADWVSPNSRRRRKAMYQPPLSTAHPSASRRIVICFTTSGFGGS